MTQLTYEQKTELLMALQARLEAICRVNAFLMKHLSEEEWRPLMRADENCAPAHMLRGNYLDGAFKRDELKQ